MTAIDKAHLFKNTSSPFGGRKVVDVDTHLTEPHDLWTSRAPASLKDRVPQVKMIDGKRSWVIDGDVIIGEGANPSSTVRLDGGKWPGLEFTTKSIEEIAATVLQELELR